MTDFRVNNVSYQKRLVAWLFRTILGSLQWNVAPCYWPTATDCCCRLSLALLVIVHILIFDSTKALQHCFRLQSQIALLWRLNGNRVGYVWRILIDDGWYYTSLVYIALTARRNLPTRWQVTWFSLKGLSSADDKWKQCFLFSERELTFTFAICCRPSVCRLSVCRR